MKIYRRFLFTRSELRGMIGLSMIIILIRFLIYCLPLTVQEPDPPFFAATGEAVSVSETPKTEPRIQPVQNLPVKRKQYQKDTVVIEINSADTISLLALPGIGPSYARRIIRYRDMLGGYAAVDQLLQVYGMDSARYLGFRSAIRIDTAGLHKININTETFREMLKHPYLEYEHVQSICRYRDRKGAFKTPGELWTAGVLPDSLRRRLSPYLKTE